MEIPPKDTELFMNSEHDSDIAHADRRNNTPKRLFEVVENVKKFNYTSTEESTPNDEMLVVIDSPRVTPFSYKLPQHPQNTKHHYSETPGSDEGGFSTQRLQPSHTIHRL
jgi:hypothetical protein